MTGAADGLQGKEMPDTATPIDNSAGLMFHSADFISCSLSSLWK